MTILRYITITLNIIFLCIIGFFNRDLHWADPDDRAAIIGFGWMMGLYVLDIWLIATL